MKETIHGFPVGQGGPAYYNIERILLARVSLVRDEIPCRQKLTGNGGNMELTIIFSTYV